MTVYTNCNPVVYGEQIDEELKHTNKLLMELIHSTQQALKRQDLKIAHLEEYVKGMTKKFVAEHIEDTAVIGQRKNEISNQRKIIFIPGEETPGDEKFIRLSPSLNIKTLGGSSLLILCSKKEDQILLSIIPIEEDKKEFWQGKLRDVIPNSNIKYVKKQLEECNLEKFCIFSIE